MLKSLITFFTATTLATSAMAKPLHVVTDIAPVFSLVAQVMGGTENLTLLLDGGASPHDFALKPSQAKALQEADMVFFTGLELTPWMEKPLRTLSTHSVQISLLNAPNTVHHDIRESNVFGGSHDHDHGHDRVDPHAWMDTQNAIVWLDHIAKILGAQDIENKAFYMTNSKRAQSEIQNIEQQIFQRLSKYADEKILFFHDAYQYFEHRFNLNAVGAVTLADDVKVTPKQLKSVEKMFFDHKIKCVLVEPSTDADWVNAMAGQQVAQVHLDPLGSSIKVDTAFYGKLLKETADQITNCIKP
jgi:zinc transport system substrate-binding protein